MKKVACPLDCYDACEAIYKNSVLKPSLTHPITKGRLCPLFSYLLKEKNLAYCSRAYRYNRKN